jgi:hypothetical protein
MLKVTVADAFSGARMLTKVEPLRIGTINVPEAEVPEIG